MTADEAREAADPTPSTVFIAAVRAGYPESIAHELADWVRNAREADRREGVVEGIRQARAEHQHTFHYERGWDVCGCGKREPYFEVSP